VDIKALETMLWHDHIGTTTIQTVKSHASQLLVMPRHYDSYTLIKPHHLHLSQPHPSNAP
jgi:hypothetical protein